MKNKNKKKPIRWDSEEPRIKSTRNVPKKRRHSSKENLKDIVKGNIDYDEYMETQDWSDSR